MQEDLAVGIGDAAVDGVAAHHRNDVRVLLRLVFPEDLAVVVQVERIDVVREGRVDIHHVADDQRRAFVAAQHAGREGPGDLQVLDVVLVDLIEFGIAGVGVVARSGWPSSSESAEALATESFADAAPRLKLAPTAKHTADNSAFCICHTP